MKLKNVDCPICGSKKNYRIIYPKNFKLSDLNTEIFSARRLPDKIHYQLVKCNDCGLVRSNPVADSTVLSKLYEKSLLTYDEEIKNLVSTYINNIKPILKKLPKNAKILEIGCGNGFVLKKIYDMGFKNVFGVEPSTDAVNKADKHIKTNLKNSIFKSGLFEENQFDFIFFFQTFDHIPDPNKFLKDCFKTLKPNGYIYSFNHNIDSLSSIILGEKSPIVDIEHTFLYSPKTIRSIFEKNGFKVLRTSSPKNTLSLRHLFWLLPLPKPIKIKILNLKTKLLDKQIKVKLGNICIEAQKYEN